jgi:hypothetical protein
MVERKADEALGARCSSMRARRRVQARAQAHLNKKACFTSKFSPSGGGAVTSLPAFDSCIRLERGGKARRFGN